MKRGRRVCAAWLGAAAMLGAGCGDAGVDLNAEPVEPPGSFHVGNGPYAVRVADLEGDGIPEAVTANLEDRSISLLSGGTPGHPASRRDLPAGGVAVALAIGDVDGDGRQDVATAVRSWFGSLRLFRSVAGDGLRPSGQTWLFGTPNDVDAGDLDGDGRDEMVVALRRDEIVVVHFDGGRTERLEVPDCGGRDHYGPDGVHVGDATGDGRPDVVVACYDTWSVHLFEGDGRGGLAAPRRLAAVAPEVRRRIAHEMAPDEVLPDGSYAGGLRKATVADLDGDDRPDLLAVGDYGILVAVFGAERGFEPGRVVALGIDGTNNLDTGDVDADGRLEVVLVTGKQQHAFVLDAETLRGGRAVARRVASLPRTPESVLLEDLDGDGILDLVVAGEHAAAVEFLRGDGRGGFAPFGS